MESQAAVGGGSLPGQTLPSLAIEIDGAGTDAEDLAQRLRIARHPVIGRIQADRVRLDMRTVLPRDDGVLHETLQELCGPLSGQSEPDES